MKIWCVILAACLIAGCDLQPPKAEDDKQFEPEINPNPKYFVTVRGIIDPAIAKEVKLTWYMSYATHNNSCRKMINYFEGAAAERSKTYQTTIEMNNNNSYKFALDKYLPGDCDWRINSMGYVIKTNQNSLAARSDIHLIDEIHKTPHNFQDFWECDADMCRFLHEINKAQNLPNQANYIFTINIKGK